MNKEVIELLREIVDLAIIAEDVTDDTVMVEFHGHVKSLSVRIYAGEWLPESEAVFSANVYCKKWNSKAANELLEVKTALERRIDLCHQ